MNPHYIPVIIDAGQTKSCSGAEMKQVQDIIETAARRADELDLPYSGALQPDEAFLLLQQLPGAVLVDVRSSAEWQFVGVVPDALCIEWRSYPGMQLNPGFGRQLLREVDPAATLMLICRSGMRSDEAARVALQAGYRSVYNVLEGFEGDKDVSGQRGHVNGWKARGLPWAQG
jgi:rhodanese-related sulfurtransferase